MPVVVVQGVPAAWKALWMFSTELYLRLVSVAEKKWYLFCIPTCCRFIRSIALICQSILVCRACIFIYTRSWAVTLIILSLPFIFFSCYFALIDNLVIVNIMPFNLNLARMLHVYVTSGDYHRASAQGSMYGCLEVAKIRLAQPGWVTYFSLLKCYTTPVRLGNFFVYNMPRCIYKEFLTPFCI
jgi:hypothetical protein